MNRCSTAPCLKSRSPSTDQHAKKGTSASRSFSNTRPLNSANVSVRFSFTPPFNAQKNIYKQKSSNYSCNKQYHSSKRRAKSAPLISTQKYSTDVLGLRGKHYDHSSKAFDAMLYLKEKSIPRRIQRLISDPSSKTEIGKRDWRSSSLSEGIGRMDVGSVLEIGLNNKQLLERRRGLHLRRSTNKTEVYLYYLKP